MQWLLASFMNRRRLKSGLTIQSPPSRTEDLVREGGLCDMSHDFNRWRCRNRANMFNPLAEPLRKEKLTLSKDRSTIHHPPSTIRANSTLVRL
jgi:hypothetical protein